MKLWSPDELRRLREMVGERVARPEIARLLKRTEPAVRRKMFELGLSLPEHPTRGARTAPPVVFDDAAKQRLVTLKRNGVTPREIARVMQMPLEDVRKHLHA